MDNQKNIYKKLLPIVLMLLATTTIFAQKVVRYDLYVKDTIVNFTGKEKGQ
ncbi:multicopper oxidase type 3 [Riemerella anatipestifer]|nr:multicopper oxidase type 3 [Riemerella anatipestifer]